MKCRYHEVYFTEEANRYLMEYLQYGHHLDTQLLTQLDLKKGKVTAFLPADVDPEIAQRFSEGGIARATESESCLVAMIQKCLTNGEGRLCVFEDPLAHPEDPFPAECNARRLILGKEVYYYLTPKDLEHIQIRRTIREAEHPNFFLGVMTSIPPGNVFPQTVGIITTDEIHVLVERTEKIFVGAYDGEGYLIWHTG